MWMIGGVVGVAALLLIALKASTGGPPPDSRNCVGTPSASTVLVFDRSDNVSEQTLNEIRERARTYIRDSTELNELVSVFSISKLSKVSLVPTISVCRPRRTGNVIWTNPNQIARRFAETFEQPITAAIEAVQGPGPESPLSQAFVDLSLSGFLQAPRNRLLVFSDMLENTPGFSVYHCPRNDVIEHFRESRRGAVERPKFKNTFVGLHIIPRLGVSSSTLRCRDSLWVWFFGDDAGPQAGLDRRDLPGGPTPHSAQQ